jgi:DNA invertase Pin-like site-specific DNA recombinase
MKHTAQDPIPSRSGALVYVRVSTEERARNAGSLKAQIERVQDYLQLEDLHCAGAFRDDGVPASKPLGRRPEGARMLKAIRRGDIGHVVALRLDRLFGSAGEAIDASLKWKRQGISLHLIDVAGQVMNTGCAVGEMMLSVIAAVAEVEYAVNAERPAGVRARKERLMAYGPTPYGFERSGSGITRSMQERGQTETRYGESGTELVPEPEERTVLEQMKAARAEGLSLRAIAKLLNDARVPCKRGGAEWYASTVRRILMNESSLPEEPEVPASEQIP